MILKDENYSYAYIYVHMIYYQFGDINCQLEIDLLKIPPTCCLGPGNSMVTLVRFCQSGTEWENLQ